MGRVAFLEVRQTYESLIKKGQFDQVVQMLGKTPLALEHPDEWNEVLTIVERIPQTHRLESVDAAFLYAKTLRWCQQFELLVSWAAQVIEYHGLALAAPVQVEAASGKLSLQQYDQAKNLLEAAIPHLSGEILGIAWARLGFCLFKMGKAVEVWHEAYASARPLLKGEELGRVLLNEGYCLEESGQRAESRKVWLEALFYFRKNPYFQAYVRYNLGISALRDLQPEAERHFLEAAKLTRNPKAATLRAPVLNGLAGSRRLLGEWNRTEATYREALQLSGDGYDRKESYLGLARTQRLSGQPIQALETLNLALQDESIERPMLYVARSMAFLSLSQPTQAAEALAEAGEIKAESDRWLWRIAKAELCRQLGQPEEAVALLEGLPLHTLHAREEVRQWPELFELVQQAGREVPTPLEYPAQTNVEVRALGLLKVFINGRPLNLPPINLTGELLVFLLENGGQASSEKIIAALWPDNTFAEKRKGLSDLVAALRQTLGWPASIQSLGRAYQLDPSVCWHYDVEKARLNKRVEANFLEGNYKEWVLEVNQELEEFRVE